MNIWHDISQDRIKPEDFIAVVEVEKGSKMKYELDKETGMLILDRVLYTSTHYTASYGFIPRTYAEDDDPLDVLILCAEAIAPGTLVKAYPIGAINMIDNGSADDKIVAIPFYDPIYNDYREIEDLPRHLFEEMRHFFKVYKDLEGKFTTVVNTMNRDEAVNLIAEAIERYKMHFETKKD
ncbi:MAG: inorganic diphosphatase [Oscillospiraceae bacterium]|nr:inorganic diphosphatase [Oscillospiraceae bacterium]